jgi:FHA domain
MTGPCTQCGSDPGFDWAVCPGCGSRAGDVARSTETPDPDRWERTIIDRAAAAPRMARARFDRGEDFYTPVTSAAAPRGLRYDGDGPAAPPTDDHTIYDRGRGDSDDDESDHTVIIRGGKRGEQGPLVYFVQRNGIRAGKVYLLSDETSLGRHAESNIVLGDDTVSKRHAKVRREDGKFVFWDLASANYSFLLGADGTKRRILEPHALSDGDTLELGAVRLTYIEVDHGLED